MYVVDHLCLWQDNLYMLNEIKMTIMELELYTSILI
jgi:hypothetical protein